VLNKIEEKFKTFQNDRVPGVSVAIIEKGQFIYNQSLGLANLELKIPASDKTNYRIASVTKQFTAMGIMILKQQGKLDYENPITDYFPGFPNMGKKITIRHLLNHTSGLVNYEDIIPQGQTIQLKDKDALELIKHQQGTYFTPGTQYQYSNSGYVLLGLIVEQVTGQSFAGFMKENIFTPLSMTESLFFEEGISVVNNRAYGYRETDNGFVFNDQSLTSALLGDGGIYTSLQDYLKWDQALYGETLVTQETLNEAFISGKLTDGTETHYGFGWRLDERHSVKVFHHNGGTCGFNTAVRRVPEKKLSLFIFMNRSGNQAPDYADEILEWILSKPL
jgi:CubicO group peptidase (beta-lactamase class C family)